MFILAKTQMLHHIFLGSQEKWKEIYICENVQFDWFALDMKQNFKHRRKNS